jgi:hypothetical protein
MTPALPHIQARKALAADLKARRAYREECQAVAAYLARAAYIPAAPRPPLGPLALAALARLDPAPRETKTEGFPQ